MKYLLVVAVTFMLLFLFSCQDEVPYEELILNSIIENEYGKFDSLVGLRSDKISSIRIGNDPLINLCLKYKRDSMIDFLLERKVELNIAGKDGRTSIYHAYNSQIGRKLMLSGAELNVKDSFGLSPLHIINNDYILYDLVENSAVPVEIDIRDDKRRTPLMLAILNDKDRKAKFLINYGADIRFEDESKRNCLDYARSSGNPIIRDIIEKEYNRIRSFNELRIDEIYSDAVNLTAPHLGTRSSIAINEIIIPKSCDEIIIQGYGISSTSDYSSAFDKIISGSIRVAFGTDAQEIYKGIKNVGENINSNGARVDVLLTTVNDGDKLDQDVDAPVSEKFFSRNNTSLVNASFRWGDRIDPSLNKFALVIMNAARVEDVIFQLEVFGITYPKDSRYKKQEFKYNVNNVETNLRTDSKVDNLNFFPGRERKENSVEIRKNESLVEGSVSDISANIFYEYPSRKAVNLPYNYFIQGAAKETILEIEKLASLYYASGPNQKLFLVKKRTGPARYKVIVGLGNDKKQLNIEKIFLSKKYEGVGDLAGAFIVTKSDLVNN